MVDVEEGIRRATFSLPFGLDHVHCYFLRSSSGGWILVDTGLGSRSPEERWRPGARRARRAGRADRRHAYASRPRRGRARRRRADRRAGAAGPRGLRAVRSRVGRAQPAAVRRLLGLARDAERAGRRRCCASRLASSTRCTGFAIRELLDDGDEIDGWRVMVLRGHADGHIVLLRDGVLIAGDTILAGITPAIGLYPRSRPDPLGDYFETLARIESLAPRVAYAGHKDAIRGARRAGRARSPRTTVERLARAEAALGDRAEERLRRLARALPGRPAAGRFAASRPRSRWRTWNGSSARDGPSRPVRATSLSALLALVRDIDSGLTTNRRSE